MFVKAIGAMLLALLMGSSGCILAAKPLVDKIRDSHSADSQNSGQTGEQDSSQKKETSPQ